MGLPHPPPPAGADVDVAPAMDGARGRPARRGLRRGAEQVGGKTCCGDAC